MESPSAQMPRYKCHKEVWALKIASVSADTITPADEGYAPFDVEPGWTARHKPETGGYFVVYEDGYRSYSPAAAFESGYSRMEVQSLDFKVRVRAEHAELADRLNKLLAFTAGPIFANLDEAERGRLNEQAHFMQAYSNVLGQRIAAWGA